MRCSEFWWRASSSWRPRDGPAINGRFGKRRIAATFERLRVFSALNTVLAFNIVAREVEQRAAAQGGTSSPARNGGIDPRGVSFVAVTQQFNTSNCALATTNRFVSSITASRPEGRIWERRSQSLTP